MKKTFLTVLSLWLAITFCSGNLFPFFLANDSCRAYNNCGGEGTARIVVSPGQLLIQGGGYFLDSNSEMLKFLNKIEMAEVNGMDYTELQSIINRAIENMENARDIYTLIIAIAKETPYDQDVINQLKLFDYSGYSERNLLMKEIFAIVTNFLKAEDVTGAYIKIKADMNSILNQLYQIKSSVDANKFPDISLLWRVNQNYSSLMLFGMYMSEVFINL